MTIRLDVYARFIINRLIFLLQASTEPVSIALSGVSDGLVEQGFFH